MNVTTSTYAYRPVHPSPKPNLTQDTHTQHLQHTPITTQLYFDKAALEAALPGGFTELKNLVDIGDIVGATGGVKRTDKGELSVVVRQFQVLTKALLPLPDKWHGLTDIEKRYRQRCVFLVCQHGWLGCVFGLCIWLVVWWCACLSCVFIAVCVHGTLACVCNA